MIVTLNSKKIHIDRYDLLTFLIIVLATIMRFILIYFNWPITNSDEGNMGILALHVAFNGDRPIFFYGLPYMGPIEGYIAAPLFYVFGPSLFMLRLGLLPFFVLFLICMYYLTRRLYSRPFAFFIILLLSLGSTGTISRQLKAVGEYPETIFFAACISLLVVWIAQTTPFIEPRTRTTWRRCIVYGLLGLIIGVAIWVDMLILPVVGMGVVLLLLFCRRELRSWASISCLLGMGIGAFPLIIYNVTAPFGNNSLSILFWLHQAGKNMPYTFWEQILGTVGIAIPGATNYNPICSFYVAEFQQNFQSPCNVVQVSWGSFFLFVYAFSLIMTLILLWRSLHTEKVHTFWPMLRGTSWSLEQRISIIGYCSSLMLLISAGGTIFSYITSAASALTPGPTARYLTCLLIAFPALLWPFWKSASVLVASSQRRSLFARIASSAILILFLVLAMVGSYSTFMEIPGAQADYTSRTELINHLEKLKLTRFYSEYWTCNNLIFQSRERLICSSLAEDLSPDFDRYLPYRQAATAATYPGYVFPKSNPQVREMDKLFYSHALSPSYERETYGGYVIYYVPA
ncbi:hypothetical protein KDA_05390 [Dictyobacter alpinus]|uniref:Glycosyltransferase RgtA/B/C/D-like domain-containing protein n=1 Tax=Dictyobacter alpinus TaxID=2014873 RepID=A0A402B118_9CHLR|nr:hypothetical protein [Dictyobacter alpinus]GCE25055.1 hypothetical protein KDA_05390 [Dictyobacter alpinus]